MSQRFKRFCTSTLLASALVGVSGCASAPNWLQSSARVLDGRRHLTQTDGVLRVELPDDQTAEIGYEIIRARDDTKPTPWVVLVPGSGAPSRKGEQNGDGIQRYSAEVEVYAQWAHVLARAGHPVFAFDKRNCHPRHRSQCHANPTHDIDQEGPSALARDLDAACDWIRAQHGADAKLILMTHGQGLGPVLRSECVKQAEAVVALAPIPRRIDRVLVHAIAHRQTSGQHEAETAQSVHQKDKLASSAAALRNQAATLQETFLSMERGDFASDARVRGATLSYWRAWIDETAQTRDQLKSLKIPKLLLLGMKDQQYGPDDQTLIRRLGHLPATHVQEIPGADHHLLEGEKLSQQAAKVLIRWLQQQVNGSDA